MLALPLTAGDPAPWFVCRSTSNPRYAFHTVAGRYVVLFFFGSAADPVANGALSAFASMQKLFDDQSMCFFGISTDPEDEAQARVTPRLPGFRFFWDFDKSVSASYGAAIDNGDYSKRVYILDPSLRIAAILPLDSDVNACIGQFVTIVGKLSAISAPVPALPQAPVLMVPGVFEPAFCKKLIQEYHDGDNEDSGFMQEVDGVTKLAVDYVRKRRRDFRIEDEALNVQCQARMARRLLPEIAKSFAFTVTRIERNIVSCYDAADGGHFMAHRDNTTKGTAHRRFAVSLFLNTGEYEGGYLQFPEYGSTLYSAPLGGAVVFSCSLLHIATVVTRGKRYMYLPFLYDDEAARQRRENLAFVDEKSRAQLDEM